MALNLEDKKALVAEVSAVAATALSVVAAEYRGLTVSQMTDLRLKARSAGGYVRVVKNTLARKAMAGTSFECMSAVLKGPLVLAFSKDDPGPEARGHARGGANQTRAHARSGARSEAGRSGLMLISVNVFPE